MVVILSKLPKYIYTFSFKDYILSMICEKLQRMMYLLIGRHIYRNPRQDHATNRNCSETEDAPKFLHKFPNYCYISLFLPASTKLIINETEHALLLLAFRIRSSGTHFVYFDNGSNVLTESGPCIVGAEQRYFRAGGNSFHLNVATAPQTTR